MITQSNGSRVNFFDNDAIDEGLLKKVVVDLFFDDDLFHLIWK